jgi:hypothetical protein
MEVTGATDPRVDRAAPVGQDVFRASVPILKFVSACDELATNFGIDQDTSKHLGLVPLWNPKFATGLATKRRRTSGSGH